MQSYDSQISRFIYETFCFYWEPILQSLRLWRTAYRTSQVKRDCYFLDMKPGVTVRILSIFVRYDLHKTLVLSESNFYQMY